MAAYDFEPEMAHQGQLRVSGSSPLGPSDGPTPAALINNLIGELAEMAVNVERLRDQQRQVNQMLRDAETRFVGLQRKITTACEQIVNGDKIKPANY